ncbi:hypothetical protein [Thermaerobacillus caldiproteolyticus]|jgi:hypothetical protein|uniref:hypothetical protein n=1 Tax=Thermaerobacillus caldiproteolyticus TaxID=247480 RepID=UPI0018F18AE7|nr:hypothetical protein [Anoxybacillus caldiproteolyticus]
MVKYNIFNRILISILIAILLLTGCSVSDNKYKAVYFTTEDSSFISTNELKEHNVLELNSLEELKSKVDELDYKVGIFIDKSVLDDEIITKSLNTWLLKQKNYPIIVVGYGNPTYVYFKKLVFADEQYIPNFDDETYEKFRKQKGYSFAYIGNSGKIYGKGYKEEINIDKMLNLVNQALKGEKFVEKMMER